MMQKNFKNAVWKNDEKMNECYGNTGCGVFKRRVQN